MIKLTEWSFQGSLNAYTPPLRDGGNSPGWIMTLAVKQVNRPFCSLAQKCTNLPTPRFLRVISTAQKTNKHCTTMHCFRPGCSCVKKIVWKELLDLCGFIMLLCYWHHQFPVSLKSLHECSEFPLQCCQVCFYENQFFCEKRVFRAIFFVRTQCL